MSDGIIISSETNNDKQIEESKKAFQDFNNAFKELEYNKKWKIFDYFSFDEIVILSCDYEYDSFYFDQSLDKFAYCGFLCSLEDAYQVFKKGSIPLKY